MEFQTTVVYNELTHAIDVEGCGVVSCQGSSRSGKTYNIIFWLIVYAITHPNVRVSVVRATLPALRGSAMLDFFAIMACLGLMDSGKWNKTELIFKFTNDSWFEFFSTDSEQKLRGRKRDILFVNEANELTFLEWTQLQMRTSRFAIMDYNPSFSEDHWINGVNQDVHTYHFITTYKDNPFLEENVIRNIEKLQESNPSLWKIYGLGQRSMVEGVVFPKWEIVDKFPDTAKKQGRGLDFGYTNDPTALVRCAVVGDTLYLDEELYHTGMSTSDIIKAIKEQPQNFMLVWSDSADPRLVDEIFNAGIKIFPAKKGSGSINAGISKMQDFKICVTRRSTNLMKELRNYCYVADKNGSYTNVPIDRFNHLLDAARYWVTSNVAARGRASTATYTLGKV